MVASFLLAHGLQKVCHSSRGLQPQVLWRLFLFLVHEF